MPVSVARTGPAATVTWCCPEMHATRAAAQAVFPERELEAGKAWREMIHRYAASSLGVVIVLAAVFARPESPLTPPAGRQCRSLLLGVVMFQGLLGMWTVTLLLKPLIVMGHLLGGLTTLGLLVWLLLEERRRNADRQARRTPWPVVAGLLVLIWPDRPRRLDEFELRRPGLSGLSPPARDSGGRLKPTSPRALCSGGAWASTTSSGSWMRRPAWPSTSPTAWARC